MKRPLLFLLVLLAAFAADSQSPQALFWQLQGATPTLDVTGAFAHYKSDAGLTLVGSAVDSWADQSGNGRNLTAPSGALRPTLNTSGRAGYPALTFSSSTLSSTFNLSGTQDVIVFLVLKGNSSSPAGQVYELSANYNSVTTGLQFSINDPSSGRYTASHQGNVGYSVSNAIATTTAYQAVTAQYYKSLASNEASIRVGNATSGASTNSNNTNSFGNHPFYLGSRAGTSLFAPFDICELIIYDRKLTAAEQTSVENYLKYKYGL